MTESLLIHILGAIFACSLASYGIEQVPSIHPQVRRGLQLGFVALVVWHISRLLGVVV